MLEIKNTVVVVVIIFLKYNGLRGRLVDSNTMHEFSSMCTAVRVQVMCIVVTMHAICEGLYLEIP